MGAEVRLGEGDAEGRVGGEVELGVALAPVFDNGNVHWGSGAGAVDVRHFGGCQWRCGVVFGGGESLVGCPGVYAGSGSDFGGCSEWKVRVSQ